MDIDTEQGMDAAVDWFLNFVSRLKEGWTWGIPRSQAHYMVLHSQKKLMRLTTRRDSSTERVAKAAGWEVVQGKAFEESTK